MAGGPVTRRLADDGLPWQRVEAQRNADGPEDQRSRWSERR